MNLELFMLALCVWREARSESTLGKLLVAQTVKNRKLDTRWPDTYADVILQRLQFSAFNAGDPNAVMFPRTGSPAWNDCVAVAQFVMDADKPLTTANHYHTTGVAPTWRDEKKIVAREGAHVFYNL